jgi:uncharacterized integral membrane protein (TIGR00698 family)
MVADALTNAPGGKRRFRRHLFPATQVRARGLVPGLFLTCSIAGLAYALRELPGVGTFSPMILAIMLGIGFHNTVGTPRRAKPGIVFALKRILRLAIIMLGLQLTAQQVAEVGGAGLAIIVATLAITFFATKAVGRLLGVDRKLAELIAAGTSICGASAVIATNTVTKGTDEDMAYAVACVTVFGTLSMFLYPVLGAILALDGHAYGLWAGASIHEIAQVVAASFQYGREAGDFGTIAKLSRVMLLAPLVMGLGLASAWRLRHQAAHDGEPRSGKAPLPWFVLGFVLLIAVNSIGVIPAGAKQALVPVTTVLLTVSLAAMGLETDIRKLRREGIRPFFLGAFSWLFISGLSLLMIMLKG